MMNYPSPTISVQLSLWNSADTLRESSIEERAYLKQQSMRTFKDLVNNREALDITPESQLLSSRDE